MYLSLDTETCGLGIDKTLLTVGLVFTDDQLNILEEYELYVKPNDGTYHVTPYSLGINNINLQDHDKHPLTSTYKQAGTQLYEILRSQFIKNGSKKIIPVGKSIYFDLLQIWDKLVARPTWEEFVSYRTLDVGSVAEFARLQGHIPDDVSGSLESLVEFFNLSNLGHHGALNDAKMTLDVLRQFKNDYGD